MDKEPLSPRSPQDTRWVDAIVLFIFVSLVLSGGACIVATHFFAHDLLARFPGAIPGRTWAGYLLALLATAVWLLNTLLYVISPLLHRFRHGRHEVFHGPSGIPVVGTLLTGLAALLLPTSQMTGTILSGIYLSDTGGLPWILAVMGWEELRKKIRRRRP